MLLLPLLTPLLPLTLLLPLTMLLPLTLLLPLTPLLQMPLDEAISTCRHQWMREAIYELAVQRGWASQLDVQPQECGPMRIDSETASF